MSAPLTHLGIVVGVDGSPASKVAVSWAARDASLHNTALTVVHVLPAVGETVLQTPAVAIGPLLERQGNRIIAEAIKIAENSTQGIGPAQINSKLISAATIPTLVDLSKEAEMIIVGCRGLTGLRRVLMTSVSSALVHHAHCPVAVIRQDDGQKSHPAQAPVLVGTDCSPASELAIAIAFDEASRRGVDLVVLHSWSDRGQFDLSGPDWWTIESRDDKVLAEQLAVFQEKYPDVTVHRDVVPDQPARRLIEHSEAAQLLVVGSHGRGGFAGMLLGSVGLAVVQGAHTPVIVARQQ